MHLRLWLLTFACLALVSTTARAANHALLIAVSGYDEKIIRPLKGPAQDVRAVWDLLRDKGFEDSRITVLADKMAPGSAQPARRGSPTYSNINAAFAQLTRTIAAAPDESHFVFVYFTGHGSRQPQFESADDVEPDGFDEVFLPLDTAQIDPFTRKIRNGLTDDEIRKQLARLRSAGNVFVWVVLDACHSGDMLRGVGKDVQAKYTPIDALVPPSLESHWRRILADRKKPQLRGASMAPAASGILGGKRKLDGMVAFSAVSEDKLALELPIRDAGNTVHSIFTYNLVKAIRQSPHQSFRGLAQAVTRLQGGFEATLPEPVYEGDLDRAFGFGGAGAATLRWPAQPASDGRTVLVSAGNLSGLTPGTILRIVSADKASPSRYLRVASSAPGQATAVPVAYMSAPPPEALSDKRSITVEIESPAIDLSLRVATTELGDERVNAIINAYREDNRRADQIRLPVQWTSTSAGADVVLYTGNGQLYLSHPTGSREQTRGAFAIPLDGDMKKIVGQLRENLWKLLRKRNLLHIAAATPVNRLQKTIDIRVFRIRDSKPVSEQSDRQKCPPPDIDRVATGGERLALENISSLRHCDILRIEAASNNPKPVQIAALLIAPDAGIRYFDLGNRPVVTPQQMLPATSFIQIVTWCDPGECSKMGLHPGVQPIGRERLLLVMFELSGGASPRSLSYLAQSSLSRAQRTVKTALRSGVSSMEAILREAALVPGTRSAPAPVGGDTAIELLQWDIVR